LVIRHQSIAIGHIDPNPRMVRPLSALLLCLSVLAGLGATEPGEANAAIKRDRPPKPEASGLRLEVSARLDDSTTSDGKEWTWGGAFLSVDVALHNVSAEPITVATTAFDEKPRVMAEGPESERVVLVITASPRFQGKPTAFVASRFTPVVLAPDEYLLLWKHHTMIQDRKRSDALKEISAVFVVSSAFDGPKEWWRGSLQTYAAIVRGPSVDQQIADSEAYQKKYDAQKEAEKDPRYGRTNAARIAALIAGCDEVRIRGELQEKTDGFVVRDPGWIKHVSETIAATSLPRTVSCLCEGWRTAYFMKNGKQVVSMAAIHGNQLRIHWDEGGGDYEIGEADWKAVKEALEIPGTQ